MLDVRWRFRGALILFAAAGLVVPALAAAPAGAVTAGPSISINDPAGSGPLSAGSVQLTGSVAKSSDTTTVLYVLDATGSTRHFAGSDCNGDGVSTTADDANADGAIGDVLDCEIGAVKTLNAGLVSAAKAGSKVLVGLEAFAERAEVADLSATGTQSFAPPGDTGGEAQPRIMTVAGSVQRGAILQYVVKDLGGSGTTFDPVISAALGALTAAPAGPKWVILLSDGQTSVAASTLSALRASGVHLGSFAVGSDATCESWGALAKLAAATGESCVTAANPEDLAGRLSGSQPDGVAGVTVSVGSTAVAAELDPVGGWRAKFTLGKGSYTASATATLTSGRKISTSRTFSVGAAPGGPPPGSVGLGTGAKRATEISAARPKPSLTRLPPHVWGSVGRVVGRSMDRTKRLNGAVVLLQGRTSAGASWITLDRAKVKAGAYSLRWRPHGGMRFLRVHLKAYRNYAPSSDAVPVARISACAVRHHTRSWSMTCHTTAKARSEVRVYSGSHVVDRARVSKGLFTVSAHGRVHGHLIVVRLSHTRSVRWAL